MSMGASESPSASWSRRLLVACAIAAAAGAGVYVGRRTHFGERHAALDAGLAGLVKRAKKTLAADQLENPAGENVLGRTDDALPVEIADRHRLGLLQLRRGARPVSARHACGAMRPDAVLTALPRPPKGSEAAGP